jgi:hypothetical protein
VNAQINEHRRIVKNSNVGKTNPSYFLSNIDFCNDIVYPKIIPISTPRKELERTMTIAS